MALQKRCPVCRRMFSKGRTMSRASFAKQRTCSNRCGHFLISAWTPDLTVKLGILWANGIPTAEIARRLGVTRNMVIGKASRLDLEYHKDAARFNRHLRAA